MDTRLVELTSPGWALCDIVLSAGQGNAQLMPHLDEARLHVDSLIFEGVHRGAQAALTSVVSHYNGVNLEAIG